MRRWKTCALKIMDNDQRNKWKDILDSSMRRIKIVKF